MMKFNQKGFTLVELLIVVAIIAILAAIAAPKFLSYKQDADAKTCQSNQSSLETALEQYAYSYNSYPAAQTNIVNEKIIKVALLCPAAPSGSNQIKYDTNGIASCPGGFTSPFSHVRPTSST